MDKNIHANNAFFRQLLFIVLLITLGLIIFSTLKFFLGAALGAITLYIVCRRTLFEWTEGYGWKNWFAALIITLLVLIILGSIAFLVTEMIGSEIGQVDISSLVDGLKTLPDTLNGMIGYTIIPKSLSGQSTSWITKAASSVLNTTYSVAANLFMTLILLFFMLMSGRRMEDKVFEYLPFSGVSLCVLKREVKSMIYSNAAGIPLTMLAQGGTASLIYWALGLSNVLFWGFLTAICGLLPLIGSSIVTVPLGIYMLLNGESWQGIVLIFSGLLIIANADNLARMILMNKVANTHPLIVIFGVIMGIPLFGFWGIIFGPLLLSDFLLLIRIYYVEYGLVDENNEELSCETPEPKKPNKPSFLSKLKTRIKLAKTDN